MSDRTRNRSRWFTRFLAALRAPCRVRALAADAHRALADLTGALRDATAALEGAVAAWKAIR